MNSNLLIVCPLKKELTFLCEKLSRMGWELESVTAKKIPVLYNRSRSVALAVGGHGKVQFGIQTSYLLNNLENVKTVFCVGAGGGLANTMKTGDVVVAEKTIEHDYAEKFDEGAKLPEFFGHEELLLRAKKIEIGNNYRLLFGAIASGDEDIVEITRADELWKKTNALAVAWEGSGGARACKFHNIPFLEIRAITDNARSFVPESFLQNLKSCMANSADFVNRFLL